MANGGRNDETQRVLETLRRARAAAEGIARAVTAALEIIEGGTIRIELGPPPSETRSPDWHTERPSGSN